MKLKSLKTRIWLTCVILSLSPLSVFAVSKSKKSMMRSLIHQAIQDQKSLERSFNKNTKPFKRVKPDREKFNKELDALFEDREDRPRKKRTISRKSASN